MTTPAELTWTEYLLTDIGPRSRWRTLVQIGAAAAFFVFVMLPLAVLGLIAIAACGAFGAALLFSLYHLVLG